MNPIRRPPAAVTERKYNAKSIADPVSSFTNFINQRLSALNRSTGGGAAAAVADRNAATTSMGKPGMVKSQRSQSKLSPAGERKEFDNPLEKVKAGEEGQTRSHRHRHHHHHHHHHHTTTAERLPQESPQEAAISLLPTPMDLPTAARLKYPPLSNKPGSSVDASDGAFRVNFPLVGIQLPRFLSNYSPAHTKLERHPLRVIQDEFHWNPVRSRLVSSMRSAEMKGDVEDPLLNSFSPTSKAGAATSASTLHPRFPWREATPPPPVRPSQAGVDSGSGTTAVTDRTAAEELLAPPFVDDTIYDTTRHRKKDWIKTYMEIYYKNISMHSTRGAGGGAGGGSPK